MKALKLALLASAIWAGQAHAELPAQVTIPRSEIKTVTSHINGYQYRLSVFLPKGYDKGDQRYPVLYAIDASVGQDIALATRVLAGTRGIPKTIVVAIDFSTPDGYWQDLPTIDKGGRWEIDEKHGAANMLRTLLEDIKPAIDRDYRTDPADNGMAGHSLGGFFTLYALFHAPDVFKHVWSSSPSMIWDHAVLLKHAEELSKHPGIKATVLTSAGREEDSNMTAPLEELNRRMQALHFTGLRWSGELADHEDHSSVESALVQKAMLEIYGQQPRQPSLEEMRKLAGSYRLESGLTIQLLLDGDRLYYAQSDGGYDKTELQTFAPDHWMIRGTGLHLDVQWQADGTPHLLVQPAASPGPKGDHIAPPMVAVPTRLK